VKASYDGSSDFRRYCPDIFGPFEGASGPLTPSLEAAMVRYIVLLDQTQQGIAKISDTISRADAFAKAAQKAGVSIKAQYWTSGSHDGVLVLEGPDEQVVSALLLKLGSEGNVRTHALRAFDRTEMEAILSKSR